MTETQASPVVKVARDLTEIVVLHDKLQAQAIDDGSHSLMPGGKAMVALAYVANLEAWEHRYEAAEANGWDTTYVAEEDDTWEPPLQTLCFWSEQWRREHSAEYDQRPTITSEANFIRWALDWAWDNELHWDDFAADIRRARVRLEDVVHAGKRVERTRVVCNRCDEKPRLLVLRGTAEDCSDDRWKCPACKHRFDADDLHRAHAEQLRSDSARRWVHQADAIATLKTQGRPDRTVRAWLGDGIGSAYCDPITHEVWVWWPDLWTRHLTTPTRRRSA